MRRLITSLVLALVLPASAHAAVRVSAFYYPWYGTTARDGLFQHWGQHGHAPPNDIASSYYPLRGLYSSSDWLVIERADEEIRGGRDRRDRRLVVGTGVGRGHPARPR